MKNFIFILQILIFVEFSASDFTSWDANTYVPNACVCAPAGQCSYAGGKILLKICKILGQGSKISRKFL